MKRSKKVDGFTFAALFLDKEGDLVHMVRLGHAPRFLMALTGDPHTDGPEETPPAVKAMDMHTLCLALFEPDPPTGVRREGSDTVCARRFPGL